MLAAVGLKESGDFFGNGERQDLSFRERIRSINGKEFDDSSEWKPDIIIFYLDEKIL